MKVIDLIEHEDGSAIVQLEMSKEETMLMIQVGVTQVLRDSIAAQEAEDLNKVHCGARK